MKTSRTLAPATCQSPFPASRSLGRAGRGIRRLASVLLLFAAVVGALPAAGAAPSDAAGHPGVVNVNTADAGQLQQLPRVGPALSERILAYRETHGKFESVEDLILVQGIGEKTFEMLRSFVTVEGETTLGRKLKTSDVPQAQADGGAQD